MDLGHKGKTVIISGGSKGIGAGISEVFAQEGANLVINYHRNKESCLEFARLPVRTLWNQNSNCSG